MHCNNTPAANLNKAPGGGGERRHSNMHCNNTPAANLNKAPGGREGIATCTVTIPLLLT